MAESNDIVVGATVAFHENLAQKDLLAHRGRLMLLAEAATALAVGKILNTSPAEAGADITALMQLIKAAQTTLPETGQEKKTT